ncbi:glycosyltransferase [Nitriliruptor alkaliphilus]|uniref:glycosyltransferase n=1 Tax=Nitriliruptor alkaliphilus TaxID=427918 RepID=UPI000698136D|nr:glycosyltransferase [Nitriliruptor alkaliphilus]
MPSTSRGPRALVRRATASPWVRAVAQATRARRSIAAIRRSGLFDEVWYRSQLDVGESVDDAVVHFVREGAARGLQPHPLFDPASYLEVDPAAGRSEADPFTHFLTRGAGRLLDPHPLFDGRLVAERHPEAAGHEHGPLGWYLADPTRSLPAPTALLEGTPDLTPAAYLDLVGEVASSHAAVPSYDDFPRVRDDFDHAAATGFVGRMRDVAARLDPPPTVSVVVPTRDRAGVLGAAIDSVLAQTWPHLELLIVDDGSTDGTGDLVAGYDDDRVRYVPLPASGVSRARNVGIEHATGRYVAYLDSDNTWEPTHLEVMVGFLASEGLRAGYGAIELHREEGVAYRGVPVDLGALRERNFIDLNALVHERSLVDEVGAFDEQLRRVVDWDLILRITDVTDLGYAPFISARYDDRQDRGDRITYSETPGYVDLVRSRRLVDWSSAPAVTPGRDSLLLVARQADGEGAALAIATAVRAHLAEADGAGRDLEIVVVDDGADRAEALRLRLLAAVHPDLVFERLSHRVNLATALDLAATRASGDVLTVVDPLLDVDPAPLAATAQAVRDGEATALQPLLVSHHDGTVVSSGWLTAEDGVPVQVGWQLAPHDALLVDRRGRDAVELAASAVATAAFRACGGFHPVYTRIGAALDLGHRLRAAGGSCAVLPEALAPVDVRPYHRRWQLGPDDARELRRRHPDLPATLESWVEGTGVEVTGATPVPRPVVRGPQRWVPVIRRWGARPRRWAIKIGAEDPASREEWGDWHYAVALRDALVALGQHAVVDLRRGWYRTSADLDDVDVVLRGVAPYDPAPGRRSLLWVISHPDEVTAEEAGRFDHVFVASTVFAAEAEQRWGRPVEPLLQATDPSRFSVGADPALRTEVLFVGNSRGVRRRIVADAIDAGLEPAIWGAGWDGLVPAHLVRGTHLPNHELARHYASADVVLADHWDDMRERGFVANRLFDAVAAGAAVVSDAVPGVEDLFDGAVHTYRDAGELADVVAAARRAPRPRGAEAVAGHTFLDRARRLIAWADERR